MHIKITQIATLLFPILLAAMPLTSSRAEELNLPDLGTPSANILSTKNEQQLGRAFMSEIRANTTILNDAVVTDYVQNLGAKLASHSAQATAHQKFNFFVVEDPEINAFAGPGGNIGVNTGLILATRSEDELAAVLSHEIAHVTQHHLERSFARMQGLEIPMAAALIAAAVVGTHVGSAAGSNAAMGAAAGAMAGGTQNMLNFTRENEAEADHLGMQTLHASGFDPEAMPSFFGHMQQLSLEYGEQPPPYLLTHPVTTERIADAENRATQYPHYKSSQNGSNYLLVYTKLRVINFASSLNSINYFRPRLAASDRSQQNAARYGYTLSLLQNHELIDAESSADLLIKASPNEPLFYMLKADVEVAASKANAAASLLENAVNISPDYYPVRMQYAQTLILANQIAKAKDFIAQTLAMPKYQNKAELRALLAKAQATTGDLPEAYRTRARALEQDGQYEQAVILLRQALQLTGVSNNMKAILNAEIARTKNAASNLGIKFRGD